MGIRTKCYKLDHCTYSCSYHIVWTPRYRGKVLAKSFIKQELKRELTQIARWKGFVIHAWHIGDEHIHLYITIPPKYSVSYAIQVMKGKTSYNSLLETPSVSSGRKSVPESSCFC